MLKNLLVIVAFASVLSSCAHFGPAVNDFGDCAGPEAQKVCQEIKPRLIDLLACSELQKEMLPPCAIAGLADLYRDHGAVFVDCALVAIRDAFSAPAGASPAAVARAALVRARAAEILRHEAARGVKLKGVSP